MPLGTSLIPDALLRDLMAAGQADLLVGMATFNDADTVGKVVDAVLEAFTTRCVRERSVLLAADAGSKDGTRELVAGAPAGPGHRFEGAHPLRTIHRIVADVPGVPNRGTALRMVLAAGELLGAKSVVIVDPADVWLTGEEVATFALTVHRQGYDLLTPVIPRSPMDGPLVTQLVRPAARALWCVRVLEPVSAPVAVSGRLARDVSRSLQGMPLTDVLNLELWLLSRAAPGGFHMAQLPVGPRERSTRLGALAFLFAEIGHTLLECVDQIPASCLRRLEAEDVPVLGEMPPWRAHPPDLDPASERESFRVAGQSLQPVWAEMLRPGTLKGVLAAQRGERRLDDELWVQVVYDILLARRRTAIKSMQLALALLPIYQGRLADFLASLRGQPTDARVEALERLAREFERQKPAFSAAFLEERR